MFWWAISWKLLPLNGITSTSVWSCTNCQTGLCTESALLFLIFSQYQMCIYLLHRLHTRICWCKTNWSSKPHMMFGTVSLKPGAHAVHLLVSWLFKWMLCWHWVILLDSFKSLKFLPRTAEHAPTNGYRFPLHLAAGMSIPQTQQW